ncbi:MAG TPA: cytochrome c [Gammaproteobacteria bacterium]|nr:cytochrome c [Gammaproteobacteria bacterium]
MSNKKTLLYIIISLLTITFAGLAHAETGKAPDAKAVAVGKKLYIKHCQVCHQKDGVGEQPISVYIRLPGFVTAIPLNESSHAWHHGDKQLVKIILSGSRRTKRMPAWKDTLSEEQVKNIVAYIKSLWSPEVLACQGPKHMDCKR